MIVNNSDEEYSRNNAPLTTVCLEWARGILVRGSEDWRNSADISGHRGSCVIRGRSILHEWTGIQFYLFLLRRERERERLGKYKVTPMPLILYLRLVYEKASDLQNPMELIGVLVLPHTSCETLNELLNLLKGSVSLSRKWFNIYVKYLLRSSTKIV